MSRFSVETSINNPIDNSWPTLFNKKFIGIERNGVIITNNNTPDNLEEIELVPFACEGIKLMRLKQYRVVIFFNEPGIFNGKISGEKVEESNQILMKLFGERGIRSIDGLYFSTTNFKEDLYSLPNKGMIQKAERELKVDCSTGYFVGDKLYDLKTGYKLGITPVLVRSGVYEETLSKLNTFSNRHLRQKTKVFNNLLEFAESLV